MPELFRVVKSSRPLKRPAHGVFWKAAKRTSRPPPTQKPSLASLLCLSSAKQQQGKRPSWNPAAKEPEGAGAAWKGNREVFFFFFLAVAQPLLFLAPWNRQVYCLQLLSSYKTGSNMTASKNTERKTTLKGAVFWKVATILSGKVLLPLWRRWCSWLSFKCWRKLFAIVLGSFGKWMQGPDRDFLFKTKKNPMFQITPFPVGKSPPPIRNGISYHLLEKVKNALSDFLRFSSGSGLWHFPWGKLPRFVSVNLLGARKATKPRAVKAQINILCFEGAVSSPVKRV